LQYLFIIQLIFLPYFPSLITIKLSFLPYFPYLFTFQLTFLTYFSILFYNAKFKYKTSITTGLLVSK
jgi:hypothetical protein